MLCSTIPLQIRSATAMPDPFLPASVLTDIADPSLAEVTIPPGRWRVTTPQKMKIKRPLRLIGDGVTLSTEVAVPLEVFSEFAEGGTARVEHHATGVVVPATTTLTLETNPGFTVGEIVLVRSGVRGNDPAEPLFQTWQTITAINGLVVTFQLPFGRTAIQWADYDAIVLASGESQRFKTGPWEARSGYYSRGLGADHGIVRFMGGKPVSNVDVQGITVEWPVGVSAITGSWSFAGQYVKNLRFRDVHVVNPRGSCVHMTACENSGVEFMDVIGNGDSNDFGNPAAHASSRLLTLWGGNDCYARNLNAVGMNIVLTNCEVGSSGTLIERASIRTDFTPGFGTEATFGVYGLHPGFTFREIRLDMPSRGSGYFTPSSAPLILENIAFEYDGTIPDYLPLSTHKFKGTLRIGPTIYGPMRHVATDTLITISGTTLNIPPGLYANASVTLSTRTGVSSVQGPSDVLAPNPGKLTLPMLANEWGQVAPGTVAAYLLTRHIEVWLLGGGGPVIARFEGDCLPAV